MQVKTVQYGAGERGSAVASPRRTGLRAGDAVARRSWRRTAAISATTSAPIRSTTTTTRRARRTGRRSRCRSSPPPTGAARGCIRAAISRASCAPPPRTSGSRCTASSTGRTSTPTTAASCRSASSTTSCKGKDNGWDKQPRVLLQVRHPGEKFVERAENEWPLTRTQVDASSISIRTNGALSRRARRPTASDRTSTPWATASPS